MAKKSGGPLPDGQTAAAGEPAEADTANLTTATAAAEAPATFTTGVAAATAATPAEAPKKKGDRASELSIMKQIDNRMKRLPSDAARRRVAGWFTEAYPAGD